MKKWKVIVSMLVLIAVAGAGTTYYFLNVKEYKTNDPKVSAIVKSDYKIQLPGDTANKGNFSKKENGDSPEVLSQTQSQTQSGSPVASAVNKADGNGTGKVNSVSVSTAASNAGSTNAGQSQKLTESAIIGKYQQVFGGLENQANAKIDALLSYAVDEYKQKKANGEKISYFYFYSKYNSAANNLEAGTDQSFNYIYNAMVKDLTASGYSAGDAQPIKDQYNSLKEQRRSALLNKAISRF